jgi:mRNA-degrading endonuclease RelE of RelBE toxin-antitoxin system
MFTVNWAKKAFKQLIRIDPGNQQRIGTAVNSLTDFPNAQNVKALTNHPCGYRLRVGSYRVLFDVDRGVRIVDIQQVKKRDDNTY